MTVPHKSPPRRRKREASARDSYHHGDLRAALLTAAEADLAENGLGGFTLRGVARRAGVSHAAPAHHFRDTAELMTELAAIGFERLAEATRTFGRQVPLGTVEHLVAIGRGYATFATRNPHLLRLVFRYERFAGGSEHLRSAGQAAFAVPVEAVGALYGSADPMSDLVLAAQVIGVWSLVHGFSDLMVSGQLGRPTGATHEWLIDNLLPPIIRQFFEGSPPHATARSPSPSRRPQAPPPAPPTNRRRR